MDDSPFPPRIDRRVALKWMLTASASLAASRHLPGVDAPTPATAALIKARGYGPDPSMVKIYQVGEVWPLTFTPVQRRASIALCDVIIPADADSPAASTVGVPDFVDEWISAPYPAQAADRPIVLEGLAWIDAEARRRFGKDFAGLTTEEQDSICAEISDPSRVKAENAGALKFFKRFRDLVAGGYYTTPVGMKAIGYTGNIPLPTFAGPPEEALRHVGLA